MKCPIFPNVKHVWTNKYMILFHSCGKHEFINGGGTPDTLTKFFRRVSSVSIILPIKVILSLSIPKSFGNHFVNVSNMWKRRWNSRHSYQRLMRFPPLEIHLVEVVDKNMGHFLFGKLPLWRFSDLSRPSGERQTLTNVSNFESKGVLFKLSTFPDLINPKIRHHSLFLTSHFSRIQKC